MGRRDFIAAKDLTEFGLSHELERIGKIIDRGFGEGSGSPGEWYYERLEELTLERQRRKSP